MPKRLPLELGRIVWAELVDPNGHQKLRPGLIISSSSTGDPSVLRLVAITSRIPEPMPADYVLLPWHPQRHPRTGLNRKSAAVCSWLCTITPDAVQDVAGVMPGECLFEILMKVRALSGS